MEAERGAQLHTLIMFNMGAILDLPSEEWFGDFPTSLTVHIIDSSRPQNLSSVFGGGENGDRIVVWDDGGVEGLQDERKAWEVLTVSSSASLMHRSSRGACSMRPKRIQTRMTPTKMRTKRQTRTRRTTRMEMSMRTVMPPHHESGDH